MQFTFGLLPLGILLALVSSYILGMGMTVSSAYILMAILVAPGLEAMGVSALAAHMLVFWYSQSSNISPPVCMAAFAGASIAKSDPMRTGFTALQFRSEEHTSELQSLMRISYAVFCLKKKKKTK